MYFLLRGLWSTVSLTFVYNSILKEMSFHIRANSNLSAWLATFTLDSDSVQEKSTAHIFDYGNFQGRFNQFGKIKMPVV